MYPNIWLLILTVLIVFSAGYTIYIIKRSEKFIEKENLKMLQHTNNLQAELQVLKAKTESLNTQLTVNLQDSKRDSKRLWDLLTWVRLCGGRLSYDSIANLWLTPTLPVKTHSTELGMLEAVAKAVHNHHTARIKNDPA